MFVKLQFDRCPCFVYQNIGLGNKKSRPKAALFVKASPVGTADIKQAVKRSATPAFTHGT